LLELEHGCIVDRNACIFCHVGIFRNGTFIIDQVPFLALSWRLYQLCFLAAVTKSGLLDADGHTAVDTQLVSLLAKACFGQVMLSTCLRMQSCAGAASSWRTS